MWNEEHDVGKPWARGVVSQISLLRQHEGKGTRFGRLEAVVSDGGRGSFDHLLFGGTGQHPLGTLEISRKLGARGRRVEAIRRPQLGIPKLGVVETGRPGALDEADEAVLALDRGLIAAATENE